MNRRLHIKIKTAGASALLGIGLLFCQGSYAQQVTNSGATITIPEGTKLYLGTYMHDAGAIDNSGEIHVNDSIVNNDGTFGIFGDETTHPAAGSVIFSGSAPQQISGSGMTVFFNDFTLNNTSGTPLTLFKALNVNNALLLSTGNINLNGKTIDLGTNGHLENEDNDHRIFGTQGEIRATRILTGVSEDIANMGLYLDAPSGNFGLTEVRRAHYQLSPFSSNGHINRFYDFRPTNPGGSQEVTVGVSFFDAEKPDGHIPANYRVYHSSTDGFSWIKEKSIPDDNPEFDFQAMAMGVKNFGGSSPALKRSLVTLSEDQCADPPVVNLGPETRSLCEGSTLQLNGPTGQQKYIWTKDDEIISSVTTRQLSVTEGGVYQLRIVDANGCDGIGQVTVEIKEIPIADFDINNFACEGDATSFTDKSSSTHGTLAYQWDFGDPARTTDVSTEASPSYTYAKAGSFSASLVVTSSFGCVSEVTTKTAVVNALPTADFSPDEVCFGSATTLTNTSAPGTTSAWDLGNGATSTERSLQHTFPYVNANPVTLVVTDPNTGCFQSVTKNVMVNPLPIADFTTTPSCEPNKIDFENTSVISSGTMRYSWNFGDGEVSSSEDVFKTYATPGTFTVSLDVTSGKGCESSSTKTISVTMPPRIFGGDHVTTCKSELVLDANESGHFTGGSFKWSDNSTDQKLIVSSSGTYGVTVQMPDGCETTGVVHVTINRAVTPALESDVAGCGTHTIDAGFFPGASYEWSTGHTSQTITVAESGIYQVAITDQNGCVGEASVNVTINPLPVVNLGSDKLICNGETTQFDAGTSGTTYRWSDGTTDRFLKVGSSGTYEVTVTNEQGCSASDQARVTVVPTPSVDLGADKLICAGTPVMLDANINNVTYMWSGPNGLSGSSRTLETNQAGTYRITVTTANGCTASDSITVNETTNTLNAAFLSASEVKPGDTLQFINISYPAPFESSWDFGNGQQSTDEDPAVVYYQEGVYNVRLDVANQICANYLVKAITVKGDLAPGGRVSIAPKNDIIFVNAYPNPTADEVHIEVELSSSMKTSVTVLNTVGLPIFNEEFNTDFINRSFDISQLTRGVYIVRIVTPRESKFLRILKI